MASNVKHVSVHSPIDHNPFPVPYLLPVCRQYMPFYAELIRLVVMHLVVCRGARTVSNELKAADDLSDREEANDFSDEHTCGEKLWA
jgi:hypothetical protein